MRPPSEPVPPEMIGTALGEIYERLVRMNDGARHDELRERVNALLADWDLRDVARYAREAASLVSPQETAAYVVCRMIGVSDPIAALPLIRDFAAAVSGSATGDDIARGIKATPKLLALLPESTDPDERANRAGFLFQSFAPSRALIENRVSGTGESPVPFTRRWAAVDFEFLGRAIQRGDLIVVSLAAAEFQFGGGPHRCPGREIAEAIASGLKSDVR